MRLDKDAAYLAVYSSGEVKATFRDSGAKAFEEEPDNVKIVLGLNREAYQDTGKCWRKATR